MFTHLGEENNFQRFLNTVVCSSAVCRTDQRKAIRGQVGIGDRYLSSATSAEARGNQGIMDKPCEDSRRCCQEDPGVCFWPWGLWLGEFPLHGHTRWTDKGRIQTPRSSSASSARKAAPEILRNHPASPPPTPTAWCLGGRGWTHLYWS